MTATTSPARFRSRFKDVVDHLHAVQPLGFSGEDIAARMGPTYRRPGADRTRLRKHLHHHDSIRAFDFAGVLDGRVKFPKTPVVRAVDDDVYQRVQSDDDDYGRSSLQRALSFAVDAGGVFSAAEMMAACGWKGEAGKKRVSRVLTSSHLFQSAGLPPPYRRLWTLRRDLRARVPVPGPRMGEHLRLEGLFPDREARLAKIGDALLRARDHCGLSIGEMLQGDVGRFLARDLANCTLHRFVAGAGTRPICDWWGALVDQDGVDAALCAAWTALEDGEEPGVALTLSVELWDAVERRTCMDAGALSRGQVPAKSKIRNGLERIRDKIHR